MALALQKHILEQNFQLLTLYVWISGFPGVARNAKFASAIMKKMALVLQKCVS